MVTRSDLRDPHHAMLEATGLRHSSLAGAESIAASAVTGAGMDELRAALSRLARSLPAAGDTARVRLWVDRAFTIKGAGMVATGTLGGGRLTVGDALRVATTGHGVAGSGLAGRAARTSAR